MNTDQRPKLACRQAGTKDQRPKSYLAWCLASGVLSLVFLLWGNTAIYGEVTPLEEILNSPDTFDQGVVEVEGEAIGEPLKEEGGVWINISSEGNNLGIFIKDNSLLQKIKHWGDYRKTGDRVKITGKFYKNCSQHKGYDLHAEELEVVTRGTLRQELIAPFKIRLTKILFIISLTLGVIYFIKLKYGR